MTTRTGIWLAGAKGSVATTTVVGAAAIRAGILPPVGCVSALPDFADRPLPHFGDLVFGGHDTVATALPKRAEQLVAEYGLPQGLPDLVHGDLAAADAEIVEVTGTDDTVDGLASHIADFRHRHGLRTVVVINLTPTEPVASPDPAHQSWPLLRLALDEGAQPLPPSSRYACAAMLAGCPFVDFTPSTGARLPALRELALERRVPYTGHDGKTGETLVKSVLAPMFARRALRVRSWSGTNLLGGGDGANLSDPERAYAKSAAKGRVVAETLGAEVEGDVHIHHVAELGGWKTAWDHVSFEGFLGVRMSLQFTWQGCDSALAAPLVLDLGRFMAAAHQAGVVGPVPELAFFFKDPVSVFEGTESHVLERQFATLVTWAATL